jgi:hypothetical protein
MITSVNHIQFDLAFEAPFAVWEADFHKSKSREILSRSHNDLNTSDDNVGVTTSPHQLSCIMHMQELKFLFHYYLLAVLGQSVI